ncbi:MAG: hypothetical protein QF632_01425 [Candidatus Woesearchaeota archaeon]|jgi:hypothetical protein|nr:hypothetical protein [Candidatus Woesearchaeota archaeon]MDP7457516.1 hypothetical protein [Candidatus Woesearchaeota archaeon]
MVWRHIKGAAGWGLRGTKRVVGGGMQGAGKTVQFVKAAPGKVAGAIDSTKEKYDHLFHYDWYFLVAMIFHFSVDGLSSFQAGAAYRFTFYFFMAIIGWIMVFEPHRSVHSFFRSTILAATAFFLPYILNISYLANSLGPRNIDIILAIMPVYLIFFFFIEPDLLSDRMTLIREIYIWIFIIVAVSWMYQVGSSQVAFGIPEFLPGIGGPAYADIFGVWGDIFKTVYDTGGDMLGWAWKWVWTPVKSFKAMFNQTLNPQYYAGTTDTKAKEKLGVRLEKLQATDRTFFEGEPIGIYASLVANTLDKPIEATISCKAKSGEEEEEGDYDIVVDPNDIYPQVEYVFEDYSQEEIDCTFPMGAFNKGNHKVSMFVDFDFETQAYLKTYFVDRERSRALARDGKNILDVFRITEKNPKAIFSDGPLSVGISIGREPPMQLDLANTDRNRLTLGITLRNRWEGVIQQLDKLAIMMPNALTISSRRCGSIEFQEGSCADMKLSCDSNAYRVYVLGSEESYDWFANIKDYKTLRCPVDINAGGLLVGATPLITEFFRINAEYHYTLQKTTNVVVRAGANEAS